MTIELTPEQLAALGIEEAEPTPEKVIAAIEALLENLAVSTAKLQEIEEAKSLSEVEALLADYEIPEEGAAVMRDLAKTDREKAKALLGGMRKKGEQTKSPSKYDGPPPPPVHEPGKMSERANKDDARDEAIEKYREENPGTSFQQAWDVLQKTKPELF